MTVLICYGILPAKETVKRGESLNVLLMMESTESGTFPVPIWGNTESAWKLLLKEKRDFKANEHIHLYFNIPEDRFTDAFWDGKKPEEMSLYVGQDAPQECNAGVMVFIDD